MAQPIFLQPVFQERIWGGTALKKQFGYDIPSEHTGECWAISAHPHGPSIVKNGVFVGKTLNELWDQHRELFGNLEGRTFPLLTKILDANTDLSVQVHPNDEYANANENGELGKTECWYIIDCKADANLIYGHTATSKEDFLQLIENNEWSSLLRKVPIQPGDFFYVPSGTIHAVGEGTVVLETQQSSDTTYRVYDYDRIDQNGQHRELHLERALDVTMIPHQDAPHVPQIMAISGAIITIFVEAEYFTVQKLEINGKAQFVQDQPFQLASVIEGNGVLTIEDERYPLNKGDHFILPKTVSEFQIEGNCLLITSHV